MSDASNMQILFEKGLNESFKSLTDRFETYQKVKLDQSDVDKLFKSFSL